MSMKNRYYNQSLSAPVRQRSGGGNVVIVNDITIGARTLKQGTKVRVVSSFSGGVTVRIPGTVETVILYEGAFQQ